MRGSFPQPKKRKRKRIDQVTFISNHDPVQTLCLVKYIVSLTFVNSYKRLFFLVYHIILLSSQRKGCRNLIRTSVRLYLSF